MKREIAAERPLTIGVNDSLVGVPTALLVGTGAIIDLVGFAPIYVGIGALTLLGWSWQGVSHRRPSGGSGIINRYRATESWLSSCCASWC